MKTVDSLRRLQSEIVTERGINSLDSLRGQGKLHEDNLWVGWLICDLVQQLVLVSELSKN